MIVSFGTYDCEENRIDKSSYISLYAEYACKLKNDTELINPIILINEGIGAIDPYVYAYIPEFNRYYYVRGMKSVANNLTEITLEVDVLMSNKTQIFSSCQGLVARNQTNYDNYLEDPKIKTKAQRWIYTLNFPKLDDEASDSIILVLAGTS